MPRHVVFQGHPDVGWLNDWWLFGKPYVPQGISLEYEKYLRQLNCDCNISLKKSEKVRKRFRDFTLAEKPMVLWMHHFIQNVENESRHEQFSWTFEWHITSWYCDEESENAIAGSPPYWFVTIQDFEGKIVHKNFAIAFDATFGELCIVRSPDHTKPFLGAEWREYDKQFNQLMSAIHEHQRIRNFRLKRLGIEAPTQ